MSTAESPQGFRPFIAASGLTNLADGVAVVAWAWLASLLTRDPLMIALVPVALRLPWFLFALPAGVVTDRVDRRQLILWMDILRGIGFALVALVVVNAGPLDAPQATGAPPLLYLIIGAAFLVGGAEVFRDNAAQTMLPAIVPHAQLERANGRLWSVELVGNALLGPAVGAFLIAWMVAALNVGFLIWAAAAVSDFNRVMEGRIGALLASLTLPVLAALLTLGVLFYTVLAWKNESAEMR